jgi:VWFA-related protein
MNKWMVGLLSFVLFVPLAYAQTAPAKDESPTIVTNVEEVTLDLLVHDKKNQPVLDLKPGDIAVTDSGSAVKISDLRLVTGQAGAPHPITLVFDRLQPSSVKNAREIADRIVKMVPANQFSFAVLNIEGRLRLFQGFTSDAGAVGKAIGSATEKVEGTQEDAAALPEKNLIAAAQTGKDASGAPVTAKDRIAARMMLASLQESQRIVQEQHCLPSLAGLLALARTQRQIVGRKVVIYFEQSPQLDSNAKDMLISIAGEANRSGVSIYTVDTNAVDEQAGEGLIASAAIANAAPGINAAANPSTPLAGSATQTTPRLPSGMITQIGDTVSQIQFEGLSGHKNPLAELAMSTGGAYITASDRLKKPLLQMIEDLTTYYEASYVPPVQEFDGKFRPVAVTPVRKGLKIRSKAGYFAVAPDTRSAIRPFEAPLMKVLSESQLPTDLKFQSAILRLGDLPTGNENALVIELPVDQLETRNDPNANLYSLHVSIVAQIKNKAGEVIEHFSEDVPRHGSLDSKGSAPSELITMQRHFNADPGQYVMEAAILDRNNEKAGAQRVEFEILGEAPGPAVSDVTMVQRVAPMPDEMDSAEPLRYGKGKVIPSISGHVPHGQKEISFFFVVHPDPSSAEQPTLEMEVLKSNESIAQVPLHLVKTSGPGSIPYLASIQASSLPSGDYEVIEKITQGGKTSERGLAFRIEGPELASAIAPDSAISAAKPQNDDADVTTSGLQPPETDGHAGHRLVITSLPAGAVPPPSADELDAIVGGARKRALDYSKSLPNFICVEVTNRSVDQAGNGKWKHRDSIAELLTYHDSRESRSTLEVNGKRSSLTRADMNSTWPISVGEFGALLNLVFAPTSKTQFEWKEAGTVGDGSGTLQALSYRVNRENATLDLAESNNTIGVGFHGLVYIDPATGGVRRITIEGDDLPRNFSMHAAAMTVDYDYVTISGRDYLLPVRSTVMLQRHHKQVELNEIAFRNYRRFASRTKIKVTQ